jgi:MFS family permease
VGIPLVGAALAWALTFVVLAALQTPLAAYVLLPLAGVCQAVLDTGGRALLARVTPHQVLARVFGVMEGVMMASLALGSLLVPILVGIGGISAALIGVAAVLVAAALLPITSLRRLDTKAPAAAMACIRRHPLFLALPPPVLESLARELAPIESPAGDRVIVQGQDGDRFYLIVSGEYDVSIDGRFIRTLTAGEGFGEIALLRDVPRTASVTTRAAGILYGLAREPFLDALRPAV